MIILQESYQERASTYVVQDLSNQEEFQRLQLQEHLLTTTLGGVLPEQDNPARFQHVLDAACGTGGWLIELAQTYPSIPHLLGVDISKRMINLASAAAETHQVQERVSFHVMDVLRLVELVDNTFDLVNLRSAHSSLRYWEWPQVLRELQRVTVPGGVLRLMEADLPDASSSPTLMSLFELLRQAHEHAGKYFHPQMRGVSAELNSLLERQGLCNIQSKLYRPEIQSGTVAALLFFEDMKYLFRTTIPFLRKWTKVPDNYEELYEQMLTEMQQPDFFVTNQTVTAWGYKAL